MIDISDKQFDAIISESMNLLPQEYIKGLNNIAVVYEDEPDREQRRELKLRCDQTLLGLYQGIPLTKRNSGYNLVLPDKITLFKNPLISKSNSLQEFKENVKHTLWHEIAHFYGLDHERIHMVEKNLDIED